MSEWKGDVSPTKPTGHVETVSEWQPIDTAPKKGRVRLIIWGPRYEAPQQVWSDTWWTAGFSVENKPTHWMPWPEPPKGF